MESPLAPEGSDFHAILRWHLGRGTRPGKPYEPKRRWTHEAFAKEARVTNRASVTQYAKDSVPQSIDGMLCVLFGDDPALQPAREQMQQAWIDAGRGQNRRKDTPDRRQPTPPPNATDRDRRGTPSSDQAAPDTAMPAGWHPADKDRRAPGLADIDAHPPTSETDDACLPLHISVTLGGYTTQVPARDDEPGFQAVLTITGVVEFVEQAKGAQRMPGSEHGRLTRPAANNMRFAGGAWTLDVRQAKDPADLLIDAPLCDYRRFKEDASIEVDLRCLPQAIDVKGLPDGLPSAAEAVLRRLHQFADANTEDDRIVMAWSRIIRSRR